MRVPLLVALLCTVLAAIGFADPTVSDLMNQARQAFLVNDYDTSKELFDEVLQLDPQNTQAIQFLRIIRIRQAGLPPAGKDPLKDLVLPKVELKDAAFSAALDFFKYEAAKQSVTVSFVPQLPPAQLEHTVTLSLSQIPFLDALRYLCEQNNAVYKVERYAIVITPVPAESAPSPAAQ